VHVLIFRRKENVRRSRPSCLGLVGGLSAAFASPFGGGARGLALINLAFATSQSGLFVPPEPPSSKEGLLWEDTPLTRLDADPDAAALQRTRTKESAPLLTPAPFRKRGGSFESALPRSRFGGARPRCEVDGPPSLQKTKEDSTPLSSRSRVGFRLGLSKV